MVIGYICGVIWLVLDLVYFVFECGYEDIWLFILVNFYYIYFGVLMIVIMFIVIVIISFLIKFLIEEMVSVYMCIFNISL